MFDLDQLNQPADSDASRDNHWETIKNKHADRLQHLLETSAQLELDEFSNDLTTSEQRIANHFQRQFVEQLGMVAAEVAAANQVTELTREKRRQISLQTEIKKIAIEYRALTGEDLPPSPLLNPTVETSQITEAIAPDKPNKPRKPKP